MSFFENDQDRPAESSTDEVAAPPNEDPVRADLSDRRKPITKEERLNLIAERVEAHKRTSLKAKPPVYNEAERREHERAMNWWTSVNRRDETPNAARRQAESEFRTSSSKGASVLGQRGRW